MPARAKPVPAPFFRAKITSKGQITVPVEIRRSLGVKPGDHIRFEQQEYGVRVVQDADENPFEKWRGIGIPGIGPGREGVMAYMRELRGYDEYDDSIS
ncbi:MAG: AbrB/MazE/SpoVT family DNA-binding domain-containing protein [Terracidiphilus sp.]|jgi:AbrB family looped-hinge helix DNA binding protein